MSDKAKPPATPKPPVQRTHYDLTGCRNGVKKPDNAPSAANRSNADKRSPAEMMRTLGFSPDKHMSPLQFLIAVMNDDLELIYRNEKKRARTEQKGGIGLSYRVECAKTAAKYLHMEMPKVSVQSTDEEGFGTKLAEAMISGNDRVRKKTMIIEEVQRISPDMPLPEASYPPVFEGNSTENLPDDITPYDVDDDMNLPAEGDTEYNPDHD